MIKQIEFKVDFLRVYMTGDTEIIPIHEAEGEIKIIIENKTEQSIIDKIDDYFKYNDKRIGIEQNGEIIYKIKGSFYTTLKNLNCYMDNVFRVGF